MSKAVEKPTRVQTWLQHPFVRHPLVRRVTGYSAGSVVAIILSEACFAGSYGWGHANTTVASAAGFIGGAIPNYILNRRWAWRDRRGRDRRSEVALYMAVALATFLVSAVVTHWAETGARQFTTDRGWQVALVTAAFLGVSAIFFVIKFFIYETVVFRKEEPAPDEATGLSTASSASSSSTLYVEGREPEPTERILN